MTGPWVVEPCRIVGNSPADPTMNVLSLHAPEIASRAGPGQFVTLKMAGPEPVLPRPFDLHFADAQSGLIDLVFRVKGRGTRLLASLPAGERLEVHGPFGKPIDPLLQASPNVAVVGRGAGISPLYFIARRAHEHGAHVTAYLSARNRRLLEPFEGFHAVADVTSESDDLLPGRVVTDRLAADLATSAIDVAFVVGSQRLAKATLALAERHGFDVYGFAETFMPCGFGHCKACAIPTTGGYLLACLDGPVIDLKGVTDAYWSIAPA